MRGKTHYIAPLYAEDLPVNEHPHFTATSLGIAVGVHDFKICQKCEVLQQCKINVRNRQRFALDVCEKELDTIKITKHATALQKDIIYLLKEMKYASANELVVKTGATNRTLQRELERLRKREVIVRVRENNRMAYIYSLSKTWRDYIYGKE